MTKLGFAKISWDGATSRRSRRSSSLENSTVWSIESSVETTTTSTRLLPRKPHRRNCVKLTQFLLSPCGSIGEITLGIFQRLFQKFLQLIRIIIHPMVGLRKFNIVVWNVVQNVRSH